MKKVPLSNFILSELNKSFTCAPKIAGESSGPSGADPIAMMEFYMKKAAREERKRQPKQSKDEMPPPPSLQGLCIKEQVLM